MTFPVGAILAYYFASQRFEVAGLALFGAGNFIYIAASDLIPEIKSQPRLGAAVMHFSIISFGLMLIMFVLAYRFDQ